MSTNYKTKSYILYNLYKNYFLVLNDFKKEKKYFNNSPVGL